jgi:hypothetical protein
MLPIENSYSYSTVIGNGTKVKFRPWKTKDEKAFLTFVESTDNVTDDDFFNYLLKPCMENPNIYMTSADIQKLLIEIRKVSMGETFEMKFICKSETCGKVNEIEVEFDDIVDYRLDTVKEFSLPEAEIKVTFGQIKNVDFFKEKSKGKPAIEVSFIEMILRIEKIEYKGEVYDSFKYDEVYQFIDNLDVKIFDKLIAYYSENKSNIKIEGTFKCAFCNSDNAFYFDEIPNFLAGW